MNPYEIILKKRDGGALSEEEIRFFTAGVADGRISEGQAAAWLMAVYFRGMNEKEAAALTKAMADSGEKIDLSSTPGIKVDKHSTGGVGDGISLALAPLVAACGAPVPMMSGRSLGHTGGTLDKLEQVPGYRVELSPAEFAEIVRRVGCAIVGQTKELCPADRTLYAIRDKTATVDSLPLICASILSKKLAAGPDALVLDVKTGSGAFLREFRDSLRLARWMISIGRACGRKMAAAVTDMDQPLGRFAGNSLEMAQAAETLQGGGADREKGWPDYLEVLLTLGGEMLRLAGKAREPKAARRILEEKIRDGSGRRKMREWLEAQGGDGRAAEEPRRILPQASRRDPIPAPKSGRILSMDCREIGFCVHILEGGPRNGTKKPDGSAGLEFLRKTGDAVEKGEPLAYAHHNDPALFEEAKERYLRAVKIGFGRPRPRPLIRKILR